VAFLATGLMFFCKYAIYSVAVVLYKVGNTGFQILKHQFSTINDYQSVAFIALINRSKRL
jgi:hypothetical protein